MCIVGLHCGKWIIMHGMEDVNIIKSSWDIFGFVITTVGNISIIVKLVIVFSYDVSTLPLPEL